LATCAKELLITKQLFFVRYSLLGYNILSLLGRCHVGIGCISPKIIFGKIFND
jgi:hypothetical protein